MAATLEQDGGAEDPPTLRGMGPSDAGGRGNGHPARQRRDVTALCCLQHFVDADLATETHW